MFEFKITSLSKSSRARTGEFVTPHGVLKTPELAIVGTEGVVKSIPQEMLNDTPTQYLIVNTFHIYTKDILQKVQEAGGIHKYANYSRVVASDSGGFQVFSLGFGKAHGVGKVADIFPGKEAVQSDENNPLTITDKGVSFEFDGKKITLTPESSMDIQHQIGSDIIFAFDECTSPLNTKEYTAQAQQRTYAWLDRCIEAHKDHTDRNALFAIVQGGAYQDLRNECAKILATKDVPGFGIGGSLGSTKEDMYNVLDWTIPYLPNEKPRHLLGIGQVRDIFESVQRGVDLFDCVIPTREARHKILYTKNGKITVRKMKESDEILEAGCKCDACKNNVTYRQLDQLFREKDGKAYFYATSHNIYFFTRLMKEIRQSIEEGTFDKLKEEYFKFYLK